MSYFRKYSKISFFPFMEEVKTYSLHRGKKDLFAAVGVALLAIPQSMAYSLLAGLPPSAGLISAIFGTIFSAGFASSSRLVMGPSMGVAILLQTTLSAALASYFPEAVGAAKEAASFFLLLQIVVLVGTMQIVAAFCNVGKLLPFISRSVVLGYFGGMAVIVFVHQLFYFLGINPSGEKEFLARSLYHLFQRVSQVHLPTFFLGGVCIGFLWWVKKKGKRFPGALVMLALAGTISYLYNSFFSFLGDISSLQTAGEVDLFSFSLAWPKVEGKILYDLFFPALAIACLGILDVGSISRSLSMTSGEDSQPSQEVFGLGVGNIILSFFTGAMPISGSATRTLLNVQSGAKTRFASMMSGGFVALFMLIGWPFIQNIPLAALAALLLFTTPILLNWEHAKLCFRATKSDAVVYLLTFVSCLVFSLDIAFFIGVVISFISYMKTSSLPHLVEYAFDSAGRLKVVFPQEKAHRYVRIIGIGGEMQFAAADLVQKALQSMAKDRYVKAIVLRLNEVYHIDASMCFAILRLHETLISSERHLVISGVTEEVWHILHRSGLLEKIGRDNLYLRDEVAPQLSTWKACLRVEELLEGKRY